MSITDIAAWYAAALATAVFGWDIIKWFRSGARLRVSATCKVSYADGRTLSKTQLEGGGEMSTLAEYCHIEVLNVGNQPTTLIDISAIPTYKVDGLHLTATSAAFVTHVGSRALPAVLGPGELWSARLEMNSLESVAKHGTPIIRIRASHRRKPIDTSVAMLGRTRHRHSRIKPCSQLGLRLRRILFNRLFGKA